MTMRNTLLRMIDLDDTEFTIITITDSHLGSMLMSDDRSTSLCVKVSRCAARQLNVNTQSLTN
jgi:hypothetical protein